ncbi:MAG: hypothetical protein NW208_06370 [Bryobacter sp.]|nr:hypothetical protein [Bryobacter sp.]
MPSHSELIAPDQDLVADRASYLVLQIGIPAQVRILKGHNADGRMRTRQLTASHIRRINFILQDLGVTVERLTVTFGTNCSPHYVFSFPFHKRRDEDALRLAEAFGYGFAIASGPVFSTEYPLVLRLPSELVGRRSVAAKTLLDIKRSRFGEERYPRFPRLEDFTSLVTVDYWHELAWRIARITFRHDRMFEATRFLQRSYECFYVFPGGIDDVVYDDAPPQSAVVRSRYEDALQNAFKAVEAIIGDPPKDDRRLLEKLRLIGIDALEPVGYRVKEPIADVIRSMCAARDKKSAHGSTRDRLIKPNELLEFQACAAVLVLAGLESNGVSFGSR